MASAFVIGLRHESAQRREPAAQQKLDVTNLAGREVPGRPFAGMGFKFSRLLVIDYQVDQFAAMRRY
jgi:hypothetical protein